MGALAKRTQLHKREAGHLGQKEDWWYLVEADDGSQSIEHEWNHMDTKSGKSFDGKEIFVVEEFLKSGHPDAVQKLRSILGTSS